MSKITVFEHLKACAEEARDYAGGLVAKLAKTATEAIEELEQAKADKAQSVAITIPATGWASDSGGDYPHYYDIAAEGVTAKDRAEISIAPGSMDAAKACGLCPASQTLAGKIRVRATTVPTAAIVAEYWIENGKE